MGGCILLVLTPPSETLSTGDRISRQHLWEFLQEFTVVRSERSSSAIVSILDVS